MDFEGVVFVFGVQPQAIPQRLPKWHTYRLILFGLGSICWYMRPTVSQLPMLIPNFSESSFHLNILCTKLLLFRRQNTIKGCLVLVNNLLMLSKLFITKIILKPIFAITFICINKIFNKKDSQNISIYPVISVKIKKKCQKDFQNVARIIRNGIMNW